MSGQSSSPGGAQGGQPAGGQPGSTQPGGQPQSGTQTDDQTEVETAKLGLLAFGVVALGYFIVTAFGNLLGDDQAGFFGAPTDDGLFWAVHSTAEVLGLLGVVVAVGLAIYFYRSEAFEEPIHKLAVIGTGAGVAAISILLLILGLIFEPDGADISFGDEIPGLLGLIVGLVVVAGIAGYLLEEDPLDLL